MEGKGRDHQVRRVHIIYFLSRMGRVEHPHLIRVHHLNRNGVYLRDVKRWLADLRGKDMPESFAWSYKRRYKTGYVWQDLLDDDLITPISDNEYVLKGSQISSFPFETEEAEAEEADPCSNDDNKATIQKQQPVEVVHLQEASTEEAIQGHPDSEMRILTKTSSEINQESPPFGSETSTLTDDSMKIEQEKPVEEATKPNLPQQSQNFINNSSYSNFMSKESKKKKKKKKPEQSSGSPFPTSFTKGRSQSSGVAHMFRNLISCGAVHTRDSVIAVINRSNKPFSNNPDNKSEICRGEKLGGSGRIFGSPWNHQQDTARKSWDGSKDSKKKKSSSDLGNQKTVFAAYKPIAGPNCSQCGKSFKPEKMHAHMKSCKGMKALAKTAATSIEMTPSRRSVNFSNNEPAASGYFLTH